MRDSCLDCTRKHLAQAIVLMVEAKMGYPEHKWLAIGHMAEAEAEILERDEPTASYIRGLRKQYEAGEDVKLLEVIRTVSELDTNA